MLDGLWPKHFCWTQNIFSWPKLASFNDGRSRSLTTINFDISQNQGLSLEYGRILWLINNILWNNWVYNNLLTNASFTIINLSSVKNTTTEPIIVYQYYPFNLSRQKNLISRQAYPLKNTLFNMREIFSVNFSWSLFLQIPFPFYRK